MYLGSCSEPDGESDMDIRRRIELDCTCIKALNVESGACLSHCQPNFVLQCIYTLSVLLYRADTWSMIVASKRRLDAFDQWCLRYILHIQFTAHVTNQEVCSRTGQPPVTSLVNSRRLKLFGHIARAEPAATKHAHCELPTVVSPRICATQEVVHASLGYEADLKPLNFGLNTALSACGRSFRMAQCRGNNHAL